MSPVGATGAEADGLAYEKEHAFSTEWRQTDSSQNYINWSAIDNLSNGICTVGHRVEGRLKVVGPLDTTKPDYNSYK